MRRVSAGYEWRDIIIPHQTLGLPPGPVGAPVGKDWIARVGENASPKHEMTFPDALARRASDQMRDRGGCLAGGPVRPRRFCVTTGLSV